MFENNKLLKGFGIFILRNGNTLGNVAGRPKEISSFQVGHNNMRIPKRYGEYRREECPFCGKQSITKNPQGVPVCLKHKERLLDGLKCVCGEWLDLRQGKWGPYFFCNKCGNINFKRALELNPQIRESNNSHEADFII